MWPDDYIAWAESTRPIVVSGIERALYPHLQRNPQWTEEAVAALAEQATRRAFDVANDHRRYPEYCRTEAEFRTWVYTIGLNEVLRLLIRHRFGEPRFQLLSADQRRFLGMKYLDQLPPGDIAAVLQVSSDVVREHLHKALADFFRLLGQPEAETES